MFYFIVVHAFVTRLERDLQRQEALCRQIVERERLLASTAAKKRYREDRVDHCTPKKLRSNITYHISITLTERNIT